MTKPLWTDPVVLVCVGIIVVGLFALVWAIGKFRKLKGSSVNLPRAEADLILPDARALDKELPSASVAPPTMAVTPPAPVVSKEMAERLEGMTQRLSEMQALLAKQQSANAAAEASAASAGVGQGFSPETMDKLLKIIGNVIQQVDILQKNLNPPKESSVGKTESAVTKI